jgi:hypothetical protein
MSLRAKKIRQGRPDKTGGPRNKDTNHYLFLAAIAVRTAFAAASAATANQADAIKTSKTNKRVDHSGQHRHMTKNVLNEIVFKKTDETPVQRTDDHQHHCEKTNSLHGILLKNPFKPHTRTFFNPCH